MADSTHEGAIRDVPARVLSDPGPEYSSSRREWQGIPTIERAANGRLWAAWYTGGEGEGPGNHVVVHTSGDDGGTWLGPVFVVVPPDGSRCFDPCLWHDAEGRLWLFWAQCGRNLHWDGRGGVWCIRCDDAGGERPRWSAPRRITSGVMMNKPAVFTSGEWALPCAVWQRTGPLAPDSALERRSCLWVSTDAGATWRLRGGAEVPERTFDEHMVVERRDGSLWMLVRTRAGIGESVSADRGVTWSPGRPSRIIGPGSRFHIRRLRSGRLLLLNHLRSDARSHLAAVLSDDDGRTWNASGLMLDERTGVSYPDAVEAPDGRIFAIHDHHRGGPRHPDHEREILMSVFREQDVLSGAAGPDARLRVVIDRNPASPR